MNLAIKNQENSNAQTQYTFSPTPNWLLRRKEISHGGKLLYGKLCQYSGRGRNSIFPSRERLADDLGMSVRAVDRFIKEITSLNLIQVIRNGKTLNNSYKLLSHIWMKDAPVYDLPKVATGDLPKVATPYKEISLRDNIIHRKKNDFVENSQEPNPSLEAEFDEWWKVYPRKQSKSRAYLSFCNQRKNVTFEILLCKAKSYSKIRERAVKKDQDQELYTQMPHNWLEGDGWQDHYGRDEVEPSGYIQSIKIEDDPTEAEEIKLIRNKIKETFGDAVYRSWFFGQEIQVQGRKIIIKADTEFKSNWIKDRFSSTLLKVMGLEILICCDQRFKKAA